MSNIALMAGQLCVFSYHRFASQVPHHQKNPVTCGYVMQQFRSERSTKLEGILGNADSAHVV